MDVINALMSRRGYKVQGCMEDLESEGEEEEEVPSWLYEEEDPASYFMPINTLRLTDPRTVVRV